MRKRILSMLMVVCMMLSLLPTIALAGEIPNGYVDGGEVTTTGIDLNAAPSGDTYYKAGDGYALWEPSKNTLTLQDATIDTTTGNAFAIALLDAATGTDVTIVAEGNNVLTATNDAIVQNSGNTVIEGNGTLTVTSVHTAIHCNYGVSLTITGNVNAKFDGQDADVVVGEDLNILGNASVTAHGIMGLSSGRNITIDTAGDVDAPVIMSDGTFNYTAGNMTGSWVVEERDNFLNCLNSVYGSLKLTKDTTISYRGDVSGDDGLTIAEHAILTIPAGITLTVQDGTAITNNGTIINNGTIAFPAGTTVTEILALGITGTGIVIIGNDTIVVGGSSHPYGGDVSTTGLNLSITPTVETYYKAGSGYALYTPSNNTLTLNNATIDTAQSGEYAITLPQGETTLVAEGDNVLKTTMYGILQNDGNTVIEGSGTLTVKTDGEDIYINAGGTLTIRGNVKVQGDGQADGILANKGVNILEHASVTAAGMWALSYNGDITINTTGTVNAPKIEVMDTFFYTSGNMTGSWVVEKKGDYSLYWVNSVYGNVELTEDKVLINAGVEDGLTVTQGASLTIPAGITLTMESGTKIINNGTIVNNGTIAFPAGTAGAEILALKITGTGTIKIGDKDSIVVGEKLYPLDGDVSTTGLNLSANTPTGETYYKAGSGYALYTPSNNTLTLHNVTIDTTQSGANAITLPDVAFTIVAEGDNVLTSGSFGIFQNAFGFVIKGNGKLTVTADTNIAIICGSGYITITDDVTVNATSKQEKCFDILSDLGLNILGNASVTASDIKSSLYSAENMTINTTGTVNAPLIYVVGNFTHTAGTMTGSMVIETKGSQNTYVQSVYGSVQLTQNTTILNQTGEDGLTVTDGAMLTIPVGIALTVEAGTAITNNGKLINHGEIILPADTTDEGVLAAVGVMKPTGTGLIKVGTKYYSNSGQPMNIISAPLDLSAGGQQSGAGYSLTGGNNEGYVLSLEHVYLNGDLSLPAGVPVTISTHSQSVIEGDILFQGSGGCNVEFAGGQPLIINGRISGGIGGDTIAVTNGAQLRVIDGIGLGSSPGQGDTLIVSGSNTILFAGGNDAVIVDTLEVVKGAVMEVRANRVGVRAGAGGVSITGGSTLNVGCDYGVYIVDGKLTIDKTSKLVTDAAIAPFCVVDTTKSKAQGDMVSISGVPSSTAIASVLGTDAGFGYKYWSLVPTGGTLGVTDESSEPVTLSGAVQGTVSFATSKKNSDDSSSGGGGGSVSSSYTITAKSKKGGTISPDGAVSVAKDTNKTFTISATKGYAVKDVLVDGVSVGNVTTYTFDKVAKAHTITASFEEIKEVAVKEEVKEEVADTTVSYSDVKNSDWFKTAVDYVTENELMSGTGDGKFSPNISTNRGMIVTILWRLEGQPSASKKADFTDVAQGQYYTDAVAWAAENKIVEGYGNGQFGSQDTITREQMASILYRYAKFKGYDTTQGTMVVSEFSDYGKISGWALESVTWAVNAGLISGVDDSQLDPSGKATRGQVASILMRYCENMDKLILKRVKA